jgi:hypothetical protein
MKRRVKNAFTREAVCVHPSLRCYRKINVLNILMIHKSRMTYVQKKKERKTANHSLWERADFTS